MKRKLLIAGLTVFGILVVLGMPNKKALASCLPGDGSCVSPYTGSTVNTSAPAPNSINLNPPSTAWPGSGGWSGNAQPFYDVGNDTAYPKSFNKIPIYLRAGDTIDLTITNASPDCQATDPNTGLHWPDYSDNFSNAGPPTTYSITSVSSGTIKGPVTIDSTAACSTTVSWTGIHAYKGDDLSIGGTPVDSNGISGSGYVKEIYLLVSVNPNGTVQGENAFRVDITNTSNDSELASGSDAVGYGYREGDLSYGNVYTQQIVFGADESCTNYDTNKQGSLIYTDMDANNLNWNPDIRIVLQREAWGNNDGFTNWQPVEIIDNATLRAQTNNVLHTLATKSFDTHYRYRLLLENVGVRNTIFIGLNGDISQISGKYHLKASDCSTFVCSATIVDATDVRVTLTNKGPYPFGNGFQLRQAPDTGNGPWPASGFSSNFSVNGSLTHTFTRPADAIENYTLYDGTGANAEVVGKKPLCKAANNSINAQCDYTYITVATGQSGYNGQYKVTWLDSGGNVVGDYPFSLPPTSQLTTVVPPKDTFNTFPALRPHNAYTAELFVGTASGWPATPDDTDVLPLCLHGACPPTPAPVTQEVGQLKQITYVFSLTNDTLKEFASEYSVTITVSNGLVLQSPVTQTIDIKANGTNNVQVTFNVIENYDGKYSIQLNYNGSPISLDSWIGQCTAPTEAITLPYFQVWNSDISTGGGFADATNPRNSSPDAIGACADTFPYIDASSSPYSGGIVGFGEETSYLGSQVDFGAQAMGLIPGGNSGLVGFFSGSPYPHTPDSSPKPLFANTGAVRNLNNRGGYLNGTAPNFHCVKDYYDDTQSNPTPTTDTLDTIVNTDCGIGKRCQYSYSGDSIISGATMPVDPNGVSNQVTLYVDGNVTITGNITYPKNFDAYTPDHIPYLTIIAKGNIILGPGVTELDGLYIAQPTGATNGIFATCDNSASVCNRQLVVNGAVIAQQVELLRMHGTLHQPGAGDVNGVGANPAEIFNFVPSMVLGTPAFPAQFGQLDGVFNLPPVF